MSNVEYNEDKKKFRNPLTGRMTKIEGPTHKAICRKINSGELKDKDIIDKIPDCPKLFVRGRKPGTRFNKPDFQGGYTNIYGETDIQEVKEREVKEQEPEEEIKIKIKKEKKHKKTQKEKKVKIEKKQRGRPKKKQPDLQPQLSVRPATPPPQKAYIAEDAGNFGVMGDALNQKIVDFRFETKTPKKKTKAKAKAKAKLVSSVIGAMPTQSFVEPNLESKQGPVRPTLASLPKSNIEFSKLKKYQKSGVDLLKEMQQSDEILNIKNPIPLPPVLPVATNIDAATEEEFWSRVEDMDDITPQRRTKRKVKKELRQAMSAVI